MGFKATAATDGNEHGRTVALLRSTIKPTPILVNLRDI